METTLNGKVRGHIFQNLIFHFFWRTISLQICKFKLLFETVKPFGYVRSNVAIAFVSPRKLCYGYHIARHVFMNYFKN